METNVKVQQPAAQGPQMEAEGEGKSMLGPEGGAGLQLQAAADGSPQVQQLKRIQDAANASPQVRQLRRQGEGMNQGTLQRKENKTGLPDDLKAGVESLSGLAMDDVRVHYNSDKPAQLQAHAYAQGSDIHVAPGQEQHLAHEAWHVVQQKQGRVQATQQLKGVGVNDDSALEREADAMGAKAMQLKGAGNGTLQMKSAGGKVVQAKSTVNYGGVNGNGVGTYMNATIDPADIGGGSSPKEEPSWWSKMGGLSGGIQTFASNYLVQGHLLNDNLGGPGVMKNMTPITKSANTQMLNFYEKNVKDEVINNNRWVKYNVEAKYHCSKAPTAAELAGSNLSSTDQSTLDSSGYLDAFCDWIYADYSVYDGKKWTDSKGLWVKNESNEKKGTF